MSPLLTTRGAGSATGFGRLFAAGGDFESIATITLSATSTSISFTSIPSTYKHLQLRHMTRYSGSTVQDRIVGARFNSDSSSNYHYHYLTGDAASQGSAAVTGSGLSQNHAFFGYIPEGTNDNLFGINIVNILDYANTSKNKTAMCLGGYTRISTSNTASWTRMAANGANTTTDGGTGQISIISSLWPSTSVIDTITIGVSGAMNGPMPPYSHFALYGIKDPA